MKKQKVYISGKITGDDDYLAKFRWASVLAKMNGFIPINPTKGEKKGKPWSYYMKRDVKKLVKCDAILLIYDWAVSRGARIERSLAKALGLDVYCIVKTEGGCVITEEAPECEADSQ